MLEGLKAYRAAWIGEFEKRTFFVNENVFCNYDAFGYVTFLITIALFKGFWEQSAKPVQQSRNICQIPCFEKCPPQILSDSVVFQTPGKENDVREFTPNIILFHTSGSPICLPGDFSLANVGCAPSFTGIPWFTVDPPAQTPSARQVTQIWR